MAAPTENYGLMPSGKLCDGHHENFQDPMPPSMCGERSEKDGLPSRSKLEKSPAIPPSTHPKEPSPSRGPGSPLSLMSPTPHCTLPTQTDGDTHQMVFPPSDQVRSTVSPHCSCPFCNFKYFVWKQLNLSKNSKCNVIFLIHFSDSTGTTRIRTHRGGRYRVTSKGVCR